MSNRQRIQQLLSHRPVRYVMVGGWNTFLGYSLFVLFYGLFKYFRLTPIAAGEAALITSNVLTVLQAYFLYKHLVFRTPHLSWMEFFRFSSVYAVQITANLIVLPSLISLLRWDPRLVQAMIVPVFVVLSYLAHHHISFRQHQPSSKVPLEPIPTYKER